MSNDRYIIKRGKFGLYFYDVDEEKDMTLEHVLGMINYLARRDSMEGR